MHEKHHAPFTSSGECPCSPSTAYASSPVEPIADLRGVIFISPCSTRPPSGTRTRLAAHIGHTEEGHFSPRKGVSCMKKAFYDVEVFRHAPERGKWGLYPTGVNAQLYEPRPGEFELVVDGKQRSISGFTILFIYPAVLDEPLRLRLKNAGAKIQDKPVALPPALLVST